MKSSPAFTRLELVVALLVLVVLYFLLFPSVGVPLESSPRAQAKNDVVQIATAVTSFRTEYGRLPSTDTNVQDVGGRTLQALLGADKEINPRQIVFLEVQPAKKKRSGLSNGMFVDPWGAPYRILFDGDGDGKIENAGPPSAPAAVISNKVVAVWNDPGAHSDWANAAKKQKRAVRSWD